MKKLMIILIVFVTGIYAQSQKTHPLEQLQCSTCHSCEIPTKENPCLISCPRDRMITMEHSPEEGPGTITMNEMFEVSDLYSPVVFTHRLHSEMSGMSGGCSMCHHYNPPGRVVPCKDCHETSRKRSDISKPDLKGAYHQLCIDCHRTWGGSVNCESCHALNSTAKTTDKTAGKKQTSGRVHPEIVKPTKLVYETDYEDGKIVTFYHNEHVDLYGFQCSDCHKNETCAKCHEMKKASVQGASLEDKHEFCSACHNVDNACEHCHKDRELAPFNHQKRTGFALTKYHTKLTCTQCHGTNKKFAKMSSECVSCHRDWAVGTFNHKVTGLVLSENHAEVDCEMCHVDKKFAQKPTCDNCHEADIMYPDYAPGEFVKTKK
jgi:hypothetical protein